MKLGLGTYFALVCAGFATALGCSASAGGPGEESESAAVAGGDQHAQSLVDPVPPTTVPKVGPVVTTPVGVLDPCLSDGIDSVCTPAGVRYSNACYAAKDGATSWGPCQTCLANPSCTSSPKTTAGYDPLYFIGGTDPGDPSFPQELTAAGCAPEQSYFSGVWTSMGQWSTAICPSKPAESAADIDAGTSGVISCDSCTGDPPVGYVVFAWLSGVPVGPQPVATQPVCNPSAPTCSISSGICDPPTGPICELPSDGCESFTCMQFSQQEATGTTPTPPPSLGTPVVIGTTP
jgi:hypothetical protein